MEIKMGVPSFALQPRVSHITNVLSLQFKYFYIGALTTANVIRSKFKVKYFLLFSTKIFFSIF